jgi:uncharacterized protein
VTNYIVIYRYAPDSSEGRAESRPAHREFLKGQIENGHLVLSGPINDHRDAAALLIMEGESEADVASLLDNDPFMTGGFIVEREIRRFEVVFGSLGSPVR